MKLVLCWHMHQPDYRLEKRFLKPWTWLHAIKDYSDMAAHLEEVQGARAVVNFSPVLMLQLRDYPRRIRNLVENDTSSGDTILDAIAGQLPSSDSRLELAHALLRVNESTMKPRYGAYSRLFDAVKGSLEAGAAIEDGTLQDLAVWYALTWLGESLRGESLPVRLRQQASQFSLEARRELLRWLADVMDDLLPRYRALAEVGHIELSVTPWSHPILPLLQNFECARESLPGVSLPGRGYPGGEERCDWQVEQAISLFQEQFGRRPSGCWPSEGGLSDAVVRLLGRHGFRWTASGTQVLRNSLDDHECAPQLDPWQLYQAGHDRTESPVLFFRDDELSDRIGFEYSRWEATDAVDDLITRIEQRQRDWQADAGGHGEPVLAIIMDGENAWEYFPENGQAFLRSLYKQLAAHPDIQLCTFAEALHERLPRVLERLAAGSWVHGNFSTWIGDPAKNRAWELLAEAKCAVDRVLGQELEIAKRENRPPPSGTQDVLRQLAVCEASDWSWWLGPENRLQDGPEFDRLYRLQLGRLYRMLGLDSPAELDQPVDSAHAADPVFDAAPGGAMRRSGTDRE